MILASRSPRRVEILSMLTDVFDIVPADIDEETIKCKYMPFDTESKGKCVTELALAKARAVAAEHDDIIIASDTLVFNGNEPMGKPIDDDDARRMLFELAGHCSEVYTGVAIIKGGCEEAFFERSAVEFIERDSMYDFFVEDYIKHGGHVGKAGAYGIQDKGALLIKRIDGDFYNIMGLPVEALRRLKNMI